MNVTIKFNWFFQTQTKLVSDDVLEALEKEEKTERDIKLILDLVQHLPVCFTISFLEFVYLSFIQDGIGELNELSYQNCLCLPNCVKCHALTHHSHFKAFNNMTSNLRKDLCSVMRYAQIEEENKILISNGAQLDTWVVILNGLVEIEEANEVKVLQTGDWFVYFV